jgi:hypothetical protein
LPVKYRSPAYAASTTTSRWFHSLIRISDAGTDPQAASPLQPPGVLATPCLILGGKSKQLAAGGKVLLAPVRRECGGRLTGHYRLFAITAGSGEV